ncbi:MAG: hypothetical protein WDM79_00605 [Terricaulis sp.]
MKAQLSVLIALALLVAGCGGVPSDCTDGCVDVCEGASPFSMNSCVSEYNADYQRGYSLGLVDGRQGRLTDGVNSPGFVDGYWDGVADGQASR